MKKKESITMALSPVQATRLEALFFEEIRRRQDQGQTPLVVFAGLPKTQQRAFLRGLVQDYRATREAQQTALPAAQAAETANIAADISDLDSIGTEIGTL
jgi:hypothetical protein